MSPLTWAGLLLFGVPIAILLALMLRTYIRSTIGVIRDRDWALLALQLVIPWFVLVSILILAGGDLVYCGTREAPHPCFVQG